jgi:hypothetical protein
MIRSFEALEVVKRRSWCAGMVRLSATAAPTELFSMTVKEERAKAVLQVLDRALDLGVVALEAVVAGDVEDLLADIEGDGDGVVLAGTNVPGDHVLAPRLRRLHERVRVGHGVLDLFGREDVAAGTGERLFPGERVLG